MPDEGVPDQAVSRTSVVLRPLRWWHIAALAELDAELFDPDVWSAETFWSELAAPGRWYVVATPDTPDRATNAERDDLLGYAGLAIAGPDADVQTIAVAPQAQGLGVGRRLLTALIEQATSAGAQHLMLEVRADNEPAISLYLSDGFEQIARRRGYYQPGNIDALIMRRRLRTGA